VRPETSSGEGAAARGKALAEGRSTAATTGGRLTVLQCKFSVYLSWSQPFIHKLLAAVGDEVRNVILCYRTQHLDRFPVEELVRLRARYLTEPRLAPQAADYLRERYQPDLIHAHFGWSGTAMLLLKQCLRIPLVVTFGGRDAGLQMNLPHFDRLYRMLLDATDQVICVSKDLEQRLVDVGVDPGRIRVIYRGADLGEFAFVDRSGRPPNQPLTVLMVGRMVEKKGHRHAFASLAPLVREGHDVRLVVVGEGETYKALRRLRRQLGLRQNIEFLGTTDHAGVREQMAKADLLLQASVTPESGDTEGIPNVIVEAQATGLPVVATRHGGIVEAVRDGETGILVPERDDSAMTAGLLALAKDRERRLSMGRAARRFVESQFNFDTQVAEHLSIYRRVVSECAGTPKGARQVEIPEDYVALMEKTLRIGEAEFSLAEIAARALWPRQADEEFSEAPSSESTLEKIYSLKDHIPQRIKYPAKLVLAKMLTKAIELRKRTPGA
jgi:glycosyltransferase involved in cell wall biosynthesis